MNDKVLKSIVEIEQEKTKKEFFECQDPGLEIILTSLNNLYDLFLQGKYLEFITTYESNYFFKHEEGYEGYPNLEFNVQCVLNYNSFDLENFEAIKSIFFSARMIHYLKKYIDSLENFS